MFKQAFRIIIHIEEEVVLETIHPACVNDPTQVAHFEKHHIV